MKKNNVRFISVLLALIILIGVIPASAIGIYKETSDVPYDTLTYWEHANVSANDAVRAVGMYDYYKTLYNEDMVGVDILSYSDVSIDANDNIYILDGDTSRIHVLDKNYNFVKTIGEIVDTDSGETYNYNGAQGIVVSSENVIYICDTEHKRVILLDSDGNFISLLYLPESTLIPSDFDYRPQKIAVDSSNYIYVLSEGSYYGAILYSPNGEFLGFYGANTVKTTVLDFFTSLWEKLTTTDAIDEISVKKLPFQFTDLYVDKQDFIYTATGRTAMTVETGQIKRLSPGGINILESDTVTFGLHLPINLRNDARYPDVAGLAVSEDNYIYSYDVSTGYISIFDNDCCMLNTFGGGAANYISNAAGVQDGTFQTISSLDLTSDKDIVVLDKTKKCITIFKLNDYGALLMQANTLTRNGDYEAAFPYWEEILTIDRCSQVAYSGIAKTYYAAGDYENAMKFAEMGYDYSTYSLSYDFVRREFIEKNIYLFAGIILVVAVAIVLFVMYKRKKNLVIIKNRELQLLSRVMLHPSEVITEIKEKKRGSVLIGFILIVLYYITATVKETGSGFLFKNPTNTSFNSLLVLLQTFGIVILWTICNWAVCTLQEGKGKMREIFIVTSYSIIPLIISNIVYTVASNVILESEASFLSIFVTVMQLFTAFILITGTIIIHDYTFGRFVGTSIMSILGILIVVFLGIVIVILVQQVIMFVGTVYREFVYR
ncbi:MAG: YIP1 family protein [Acutalibacteraceae bacterium]|nr:YIP1 family protein [Acutalibacteraceae bacterium]